MQYLAAKSPSDTVAYYIDWSKQLGSDAIETFALTVVSGTVTIAADPANFGQFLRMVVLGGADGETAQIWCAIQTACGQALTRMIQLQVSNNAVAITPSSATKAQIVQMAFEEAGLPGYGFTATDAENASALRRLDALMAQWRTSSLALNYNFPLVIGGSALTDESGLPDDAVYAAASSLAFRIAPGIGKTMSTEARVANGQAMNALRARYAPKVTRRLAPGTPRGAGTKPWGVWSPFIGEAVFSDQGGDLAAVLVTEGGDDITTEGGQDIGL